LLLAVYLANFGTEFSETRDW